VGLWPMRVPDPLRGLEAVLAHQPPDALSGSPQALVAEPGPQAISAKLQEYKRREYLFPAFLRK
jgi:hypothetical protein